MMNYYEFAEKMVTDLQKHIGGGIEIASDGDRLYASKPEGMTTLSLKIEKVYRDYRDGKTIDILVREIADSMVDAMETVAPIETDILDTLSEYEKVRPRLFLRVRSKASVGKGVPMQELLDLAITCQILVGDNGSVLVTDQMLAGFGVAREQLFTDAFENAPKLMPATIQPIGTMLEAVGGISIPDVPKPQMYVITSEKMVYGAAVLFYPGVMDEVARKLGGSFYAIPSSVHEFLAVRAEDFQEENDDTDLLKGIIGDVNNFLQPDEVLGAGAYYYDASKRVFVKAEDRHVTAKVYSFAEKE